MLVFCSGALRRRVLTFVVFLAAFLARPLFSDDASSAGSESSPAASSSAEERPDVVITATRIPDERLRVPPFVITIDRALIEASGKNNLSDVAAEYAGVRLYSYGHRGALEQLWLRGATGSRVLVLLDGVPTNNPLDGQMSLSLIPMEAVDRIEIVQGGMSLLYGSQAVGGVINVITKKGSDLHDFFCASLAAASYPPQEYEAGGSTQTPDPASLFDGGRASVSFGRRLGPARLFFSGIFDGEQNKYYYSDSGTTKRRENAVLLSGNGALGLAFPWETGAVGLTAFYTRQRTGVPGSLSFPSSDSVQTDERFQAQSYLHAERFLSDLFTFDAKLSFTHQYRLNETPSYSYADDSRLTNCFVEISQKAALADFLSLIYGGAFSYDSITGSSIGERSRMTGSAFLSAPLILGDVFRLYPAVRLDAVSGWAPHLSYGLGTSLAISNAAAFKLSAASSFRVPTLSELYYPYMANPALLPEYGWHADAGFSLLTPRLKLESAVFTRLMQDEIQNDATYTPQNIGLSFYPGAEVQAQLEIVDHFFIDASYTFIYSFNLSGGLTLADDRRIPRVPVHQGHLYLSYKPAALVLRLGADVIGDRYNDDANTVSMPWAFVLNANVRWQAAAWLALTAALDNILNTQYQLVSGYPMPGIHARWGLEMKW